MCKQIRIAALLLLLTATLLWAYQERGRPYNGFSIEGALVEAEKILSGGPPRDGIPALDQPRFDGPEQTPLAADDLVLGLNFRGQSKAYPVAILNWHEVVNDRFAQIPVVISYCPLCGTGLAFVAEVDGQPLEFGVSGLLYNSNLLLYDRQSESLWSQMQGQAISGPLKGKRLKPLALELSRWEDWRNRYPYSRILSFKTGHRRDYERSPYGDYNQSLALYFPVEFLSRRYHPKEQVLGLVMNRQARAWPFSELAKGGAQGLLEDQWQGQTLLIEYDATSRSGRILAAGGQPLPAVPAFWFSWFSFYPQTSVYSPP